MRSLAKVIVFGAIVALSLGVPAASATTTAYPIHLLKDCSTFDGVEPTYCTISASDVDVIPVGTKAWYLGPVLTNSYFLSSNVRLDDERRNTATGYCIFQNKTAVGLCTFWEGTGRLAGFVAILDVTVDEAGLWHMDGSYYLDDPPVAAAATGER